MKIKNTITIFITALLLLQSPLAYAAGTGSGSTTIAQDGSFTRTCVLTGYYSPLEGQDYYVTGSYYGDKRLNGNGTNGADGTQVYSGMLAAPKNVPFGTKIYIPGIGLGTVNDRGGAIIQKEGFDGEAIDRLDIWTGSGEKGLSRALHIGKRTSLCTYFPVGVAVPASYQTNGMTLPAATPLPKNQDPLDQKAWVEKLQSTLRDLGHYNGEITGDFDDATRAALIDFQVDNNIISNKNSNGAGSYGPLTQAAMRRVLNGETATNLPDPVMEDMFVLLENGDRGNQVEILQEKLMKAGFFTHPYVTDLYGTVTKQAVYSFQIAEGLIRNDKDPRAGKYTEKTREALEKFIKYSDDYVLISGTIAVAENTRKDTDSSKNLTEMVSLNGMPSKLELSDVGHSFETDLELGDQGPEVEKLQDRLRTKGYYDMDGEYGLFTQLAICEFQKDHGIVNDCEETEAGKVNEETRIYLNL